MARRITAPTSETRKDIRVSGLLLMLPWPRIRPPITAPMMPTTMLRMIPCCASRRMMMLASQPTMPPMTSHMMMPITFLLLRAARTGRPAVVFREYAPQGKLVPAPKCFRRRLDRRRGGLHIGGMRSLPFAFLALALLPAAPAAADDLGKRNAPPETLMAGIGGGVSDAALQAEIEAAAAFPLGSLRNPARVGGPEGRNVYVARLRCVDGKPPRVTPAVPGGTGGLGT